MSEVPLCVHVFRVGWLLTRAVHTVDYDAFVPSKYGGYRDQICATQGPQLD